MSTPPDLGPLPDPDVQECEAGDCGGVWRHSEEAIRDFGQRCYMLGVAAERERCARLCESVRELDNESAFEAAANRCAEAIRAAPSEPTKEGG